MKQRIAKIFKAIVTIFVVLFIFIEIAFKGPFEDPNMAIVIGLFFIWVIVMYSLRENKYLQK